MVNSEITFIRAYFSSNYLMLIRTPHQNALTQTIKSASLGTPISVLAWACMVCDVVYMPRDVFPIQIRMIVFVRTRLCANAEIGVPRLADFMF